MNNQTSPQASSSPSPLSLFDIIVSDATAQRTSVAPAETLNVAPPTIAIVTMKTKPSYNDVFVRYAQAMKRLGAVINDQITLENQLFGTSLTERPSTQCISKVGDAAVKALISKAERMFAPPGGRLSISEFQCLKAIGQGNWAENYRKLRYEKDKVDTPIGLDLDALWAHLETAYGGDAGKNAGYRQQAAVIVDAFSLENDGVVKRGASPISLFKRMYSEKQDYGSHKGKYQAHYSYRESLGKLNQALLCFAEWAELLELSIDLQPTRHDLCEYGMYYSPRESRNFSGLDVVMFKEKWEFKFSHDVAEKLMLFLGEFSASQA